MMQFFIVLAATGFYSGYVPGLPGTAGSVVGVAAWWLIFAPLWRWSPAAALLGFAGLFVLGCFVSGRAEQHFGERDSPHIVIDEIAGMAATMFFNRGTWPFLLGGFAAFRLFDILKPFPAGWIDREIRGGTAVMLDDLAAAVYANLVLQIASLLF
jgi:phosphatidylglycerophosphatase A